MVVGQPLQETGLISARWGLNAGRQAAEVSLTDVKQEVSGRAQLHLGAPPAVICDLGCEGAARDVLVIVLDQNAVVAWQSGQVGHCACPIFIVNAADFCF